MARNKKEPCKLCGIQTSVRFNIRFKATPICESCSRDIFIQQAHWFLETVEPPESKS